MKKTENKTEEQQQENVEKVNQDVVDKNLKIQDSDEDEEEEYEEMDIQHKLLILWCEASNAVSHIVPSLDSPSPIIQNTFPDSPLIFLLIAIPKANGRP